MLILDISAKDKNLKIMLPLSQQELLKPKELKELFVLITEGLMEAHGKYRHLIWLWEVKLESPEARPPRGFIWSFQFIDLGERRPLTFMMTLLQSGATNSATQEELEAPEWPRTERASLQASQMTSRTWPPKIEPSQLEEIIKRSDFRRSIKIMRTEIN